MKKFFTLITVAAMAFATQANVLTVCDNGTFMSNVYPIYGLFVDAEGTLGQMIYPADMLQDMAGQEITEVMFYTLNDYFETVEGYTSTDASDFINFSGATIQLSFKVVEQNDFDENEPVAVEGATVVATAIPEKGADRMIFVLDEPFAYNGGNLLVECKVIVPGTYGTTYFWGVGGDVLTSYYEYNDPIWGGDYGSTGFLPKASFTYQEGTEPGPGPEPTEMTAAPVFNGYTTDGIHAYFVEINETEPSTIYYRVFVWDADNNEWVVYGEEDWTEYTEILSFTADGKYRVEAYAVAENKLPSYDIAYEFTVSPMTGIAEMNADKAISSVRYFNVAGQEVKEANGLTIVVTTYADGTTNTAKVIK